MNDHFVIRIESWPYSLGHGQIVDQAYAGAREQTFTVQAQHIHEALEKAVLFQQGMLTSPFVWQAPIVEVREASHRERLNPTKGDPCSIKEAEVAQRKAIAAMREASAPTPSPDPASGEAAV